MAEEVTYFEVGPSAFSCSSMIWRELTLTSVPGIAGVDSRQETGGMGGAYHYEGSGQLSSLCRNRSILWRYQDYILELMELSWDINLASYGLRLHLPLEYGHLLSGVTIHELASHVAILFGTGSMVYRLILPHPETIAKDSKLSLAGKGLPPSIFMFARDDSFKGSNMASVSTGLVPVLTSCTSLITMEGVATFVLTSSHSSALYCVKLSAPGTSGLPERFELQQQSMIQRLWNIFPTGIKSTTDDRAPLSLDIHSFNGEVVVLSLCYDLSLRLWSPQQWDCLMDHSLVHYIPPVVGGVKVNVDKLLLKKSATSSSEIVQFAVYLGLSPRSQISVFQLMLLDNQLVLDHLATHFPCQGLSLIDMCLSDNYWWAVFTNGTDSHQVINCYYNDSLNGKVNRAILLPYASSEIVLPASKDPREGYLFELFKPGHVTPQAIIKGLQLYGHSYDVGSSPRKLRERVIHKIEEEIRVAAGSLELNPLEYRDLCLKCWSKFYTCCIQYEQLLRKPVGIQCDAHTGMVTLIQPGTLSFLYPQSTQISSVPYQYSLSQHQNQPSDQLYLLQCVQLLNEQLTHEVFESFIVELCCHDNPLSLSQQIAEVLLSHGAAPFLTKLRELCGLFSDVTIVLDQMITSLSCDNEDMSHDLVEESDMMELFSSFLACHLISCGLRDICLQKLKWCHDLLILLSIWEETNTITTLSLLSLHQYKNKLVQLIYNYHLLYWLSTTMTTPTTGTFDIINLAELHISEKTSFVNEGTLIELYLTSMGRNYLGQLVGQCIPATSPVYAYWTHVLPWLLNKMIQRLWPATNSILIYEFLLYGGQYQNILSFHKYCQQFVKEDVSSRQFYLGQSLLSLGLIDKAIRCFITASKGVKSEIVLQNVSDNDSGTYWLKIMRRLESLQCNEGVLTVTEYATTVLDKTHSLMPIFWSNQFKYSLILCQYNLAYHAIMNNPDPERQRECLRHFIVVLTEQGHLSLLCDYNYTGLEEEVENVMEMKARSVDVLSNRYYDLLYCYHMSRENYWKAAHTMYEQGCRSNLESPGLTSLQHQANSYLVSLTLLKLCNSKYHWILVPDNLQTTKCQVMSLQDLIKEYGLVRAKLTLIRHQSALTEHLSGPHVTANEVCTLLVQNALFDDAIKLSKLHTLTLVPIFEALAARCAHLSINAFTTSEKTTPTWSWLQHNEACDTMTLSRQPSILDQAWNMLRHYFEINVPHPDNVSCLQSCVVKKLLSMNYHVPEWLVDKMKITNPGQLLSIYLMFNRLESATELAIEFINAVLGPGYEYFGFKNGLHATCPSVWLPYNSFDQLLQRLSSSSLHELHDTLKDKLDHYLEVLENVNENM